MTQTPRAYTTITLAVLAFGSSTSPARAITCKDGYQVVHGDYLVTPYCQDALLAAVAREFGVRVPASAIRENPNVKRQVCRIAGHDIRVQQTCIEAGRGLRGRGF